MLTLPYHPDFIPLPPIPPGVVLSQEQRERRYVTHTALMQDALLARILVDAAQTPGYRALCLVTGGAHGYSFQTLALQQIDRRFRIQSWFSAGEVTSWEEHALDLDIDRELAAIREDGTILRGRGNSNPDQITGMEGRIITVYLAVGADGTWLEAPRPLVGGKYRLTPVNRIFRAMLGADEYASFGLE